MVYAGHLKEDKLSKEDPRIKAAYEWVAKNFTLDENPGVGAQGGSLSEVCKYGMNEDVGLLINSSRGIIYAGNDKDFVQKSRNEAAKIQKEMSTLLSNK